MKGIVAGIVVFLLVGAFEFLVVIPFLWDGIRAAFESSDLGTVVAIGAIILSLSASFSIAIFLSLLLGVFASALWDK